MWIRLAKTEHREAKFLSKGRILETSTLNRGVKSPPLGCASGGLGCSRTRSHPAVVLHLPPAEA